MINRIKTDREVIQEAARNLAVACGGKEFDAACVEMAEALRYAKSIDWWLQLERAAV